MKLSGKIEYAEIDVAAEHKGRREAVRKKVAEAGADSIDVWSIDLGAGACDAGHFSVCSHEYP